MKQIKTNNGKRGGWLVGKRHYDKQGNSLGGIKAIVTDSGGKPVELEGGEVIINREASKKYWKELSKINQSAGNGVAIEPPTGFDDDPSEEYEKGGKIQFNANHLPNKWILSYAEKIRTKYPEIWKKGGNIFGNEAYKNLKRVSERGYWLDSEEWMYIKWRAYVARHKGDFQLPGVIAMLKWVDKVDKGWKYMKDLIQSEIDKESNKMKDGGKINHLISQGIIELKMIDTKPEHAKLYGLHSKKPLYIQNISIIKSERLKGIGTELFNYIEEYAKNNGNDIVFGYITQKSQPSIDVIKTILNKNGYTTTKGDNDFHKVISNKMAKGGQTKQQEKVSKVMHEFKLGKLKSSSGDLVTDEKQAIAIALSEAGLSKYEDGGNIKNYSFVKGITTDGKKVYKIFDYIPTHKEVFDYFKNCKDKNKRCVTLIDSEINVEPFSNFNRTEFLKYANKIALEKFNSKIKDIDELIFSFDIETLNVYPFSAELENGINVEISSNDGSFLITDSKMEQGGKIKIHNFINHDIFTIKLEEKLYQQAQSYFDKKVTDDYWHFSTQYFNGDEITYEVYSSKGGFWLNFKIKNNNLLLSSAKILPIEKLEQGGSIDQKDTITMNIPLLIRTLELSREDIYSDAELHKLVERLLDLKNKPVLTMDDYEYIADIEHKHIKKMELGGNIEDASFEKLLSQAHTNLTVKKGRKEYAPNKDELQEEIDKIIMEKQFGSNNI